MESFQMNYITGERIQSVADNTFVSYHKGAPGADITETQLARNGFKYVYCNPNDDMDAIIPAIKDANILFVYGFCLDIFFRKVFPSIEKNIVLVTHNCDDEIDSKYEKYLNDVRILKWYSVNVSIVHDKLVPIPIGIANSQWKHGDLNILEKVRNEHNRKENLVYKNFDIGTAPSRRTYVDVATSRNGIYMSPVRNYCEYLRELSRSMFSICPMGNGIDTHKMWESLYMGCIPVVAGCPHNDGFKELPVIRIYGDENWSLVTRKFLENHYAVMYDKTYDLSKLDVEYWKKRIKQAL